MARSMPKTPGKAKKTTGPLKTLAVRNVQDRPARSVRGGEGSVASPPRDPASGMPTGKRMH